MKKLFLDSWHNSEGIQEFNDFRIITAKHASNLFALMTNPLLFIMTKLFYIKFRIFFVPMMQEGSRLKDTRAWSSRQVRFLTILICHFMRRYIAPPLPRTFSVHMKITQILKQTFLIIYIVHVLSKIMVFQGCGRKCLISPTQPLTFYVKTKNVLNFI